jgi:hypothetical protein
MWGEFIQAEGAVFTGLLIFPISLPLTVISGLAEFYAMWRVAEGK